MSKPSPSRFIGVGMALICILASSGCTKTGRIEQTASVKEVKPSTAQERMASDKSGPGKSYVDPLIAKAAGTPSQPKPPGATVAGAENERGTASQTTTTLPAGLATQPTGVRASTATIFSANPPVAVVAPDSSGPVPANLPRRGFNATAASVFSTPSPRTGTCSGDSSGMTTSC